MLADKNCPALFISGTDTGIGKTIVTAALARHFSLKGLKVGVMKPIETGVADPEQLGNDATLLRWAAESSDPDEQISPYRYPLPLAPCQAADLAGRQIDVDEIITAYNKLRQDKELVLIEGAGGLMVPIRGGFLMADLVGKLQLPLLIVTHPRLGTLNHTLLTTFTAQAMGLSTAGVIINKMPEKPDQAEKSAPHLLASLASADVLSVFPEVEGTDQQKVVQLANIIEQHPAYRWLVSAMGLVDHPALR